MSSAPVLAAALATLGIGVFVAAGASVRGLLILVTEAEGDSVVVLQQVLSFLLALAEQQEAAGAVSWLLFVEQHEAVDGLEDVVDEEGVAASVVLSLPPKMEPILNGVNIRMVFSNMDMFCLPISSSVVPKGNMPPKVFL